jgi:hypothetical protein
VPGVDKNRLPAVDTNNLASIRFYLFTALRNDDLNGGVVDRLLSKLSPEANEHWNKLARWRQDRRWAQLMQWIHESFQTKVTPEVLETYFLEKIPNDKRQELLNMPRAKMEAELMRLYSQSELHMDERWGALREFGDAMRGPRNNPPGSSPPDDRPGLGRNRPGGPNDLGPGPPGRERFDRDRPPGPDGPPGMRPEDRPGGRPGQRPRRPPPGERFPPGRPPEGDPPPPPPEGRQPI